MADCVLAGPALPEPFVHGELTVCLTKMGLLKSARACERGWSALRERLCSLSAGGPLHVHNHVVAPLADALGYAAPTRQEDVATREGPEDGGWLMAMRDAHLRAWSVDAETDLDVPSRSGRAYRFSPTRSAQRVLLARGERAGLLTNGDELRLLLCDPARADSHITVTLNGWRVRALAPDSYRVLLALAGPAGIAALPGVLEAARLSQTRVTKELRVQARGAVEGFVQAVLDHPENVALHGHDREALAATLWQEALILVYRLLFILKLESAADPARAFSFAATSLWRGGLSPNVALGPLVRRHLDLGQDTGAMIEHGLRAVFTVFRDGLACSELSIAPLGGALFGAGSTKLLDGLVWGDRAAALLLDRLLWTMPKGRARERVHYGALDVEDLGRVYESLLELEPGLASQPMVRLRRAALEVVVPATDAARARSSNIAAVERIPAGRFYLRVGLGRKTTGSYYTPHAFVRFLLRETLAPRIAELSTDSDPNPRAILSLKLVDPAAGSGHFLVEACRQLGEALYAACRLCDEQASTLESEAANASDGRDALTARAEALRDRIASLPDPDRSLLAYLPSRASEGGESGVSQSRALAICRRLVAVHCLYGVDRNPLAVELAKLSLWLESYAEGLPLTFLDHRLVVGDSLTAPFAAQLATLPVGGGELDPLLAHGVAARLDAGRATALRAVDALEATVGRDTADVVLKQRAKARLDAALSPLRELARAWSGAVMLATREADDEWLALARSVAEHGAWPARLTPRQALLLQAGGEALPWDLAFPEVFRGGGFDIVVGNPPWDIVQLNSREFLAGYDLSVLDAPTTSTARVLADPAIAAAFHRYQENFAAIHRSVARLYHHQKVVVGGEPTGGKLDSYRVFAERVLQLVGQRGAVGLVVPSGFHAAEGATGARRLYLQETAIDWCLSFENRHRLFDIHARVKFALVVARKPGPTRNMRCGFYLTDPQQMGEPSRLMTYDPEFIAMSGGAHATLLELRGDADLAIARRMFRARHTFADWIGARGIALSREANMTDDAARFTPAARMRPGDLLLHEGKTIHQFTDQWTAPRYAVRVAALADRPQFLDNARHFRAACREIASSTNERTAIAAMLPPGVICGHTLNVERTPARRANASALILVALMNSFAFDWLLRQKAASHVSLYLLADIVWPELSADAECFLAHASLRLCCNHVGFVPLWREQVGRLRDFPAIANETTRRRLHAAMDAVVAAAFGLTRDDYRHVLGGFSHKSNPRMPKDCLAAYDELAVQGLRAFCRSHDPYHAIPLASAIPRLAAPSRSLPAGERIDADRCRVSRIAHVGRRRAGGNAAHRPE
jgi:hypothetical protein